MTTDVTLTSYILNPWDGTYTPGESDLIVLSYASLDYTPSTSDSYKSTSGDIFKVYVAGTRIYRASDNIYASGSGFLESGDVASSSSATTLNGLSTISGSAISWASTADNVWTIDTTNQRVTIDVSNIAATALYGASGKAVAFATDTTIIELKRAVQDLSTPAVDFSNASILTEQDLDNSAKNIFHVAQQAVISTDNAMLYESGTDTYQSFQPGTTTSKRISGVATPTGASDAANKSYTDGNLVIAAASATAAGLSAESAEDWATKDDGAVSGSDFSAKAHASVTGTHAPADGSAKEWATTITNTPVTTGPDAFSALHHSAKAALEVGLAAAQVGLATTQAGLATTNGAAQVTLATTQAGLATTNGAAQVALATTQAEAAATSAANAATSYDSFDDRYLGTFTTAAEPTVDNDGATLIAGALYFNTTSGSMMVYSGAAWIAATSAGTSSMVVHKFTASGSETQVLTGSFSPALAYTVNNIIVFLNGVKLDATDYTADNVPLGSIEGLTALVALDELVVVAFKAFSVATVEGDNILSTTITGTSKFLRADGDSTSSWQSPTGTAIAMALIFG